MQESTFVQHHHAQRSKELKILAGARNGSCLQRLGIPLRADHATASSWVTPPGSLRTGQGIQVRLRAVQVRHHHTLRLALAQHGSRLLAHAACSVQPNDLRQPGRPRTGDRRLLRAGCSVVL